MLAVGSKAPDFTLNDKNGQSVSLSDFAGKKVVENYTYYLGVGIANIMNIFQPEIICIGGGICAEGETLLAPVREFVSGENYARNSAQKSEIKKAHFSVPYF